MMTAWMDQWFSQQTARDGGISRRAIGYIKSESYGVSIDNVVGEARKRGWHVIETGDHIVILHHGGDIRLLT